MKQDAASEAELSNVGLKKKKVLNQKNSVMKDQDKNPTMKMLSSGSEKSLNEDQASEKSEKSKGSGSSTPKSIKSLSELNKDNKKTVDGFNDKFSAANVKKMFDHVSPGEKFRLDLIKRYMKQSPMMYQVSMPPQVIDMTTEIPDSNTIGGDQKDLTMPQTELQKQATLLKSQTLNLQAQ